MNGQNIRYSSGYGLQSKILFEPDQIARIQKRFNQFTDSGMMNPSIFKSFMGLLGIGQCEFLCDRIFPIITNLSSFDFDDFLAFLNTITFGSRPRKARISFEFLDKNKKGYINHDDIESVISQISFIWNFLTGEKIQNTQSIVLICGILGIRQDRSISFQQYVDVYDNYIDWYDYFNSQNKDIGKKNVFNVDQIQEYLKMLYKEAQSMIEDLRQSEETRSDTQMMNSFIEMSQISAKGPFLNSFKEIQPKGDLDNPRDTDSFFRASLLSKEIVVEGDSQLQIVGKKLEQMKKMALNLFPQYTDTNNFHSHYQNGQANKKKGALVNKNQADRSRKRVIFLGHENWNIMLNMMLGIRKSLKSYFYKFDQKVDFSEEDLNCKYSHELIYKQNNKSIKQISQIFVDYSPKVFYYIRAYFEIENSQFLKSIGLENLIGNLLMGNLSTLTDQTSEGKSGSFFYYTEDTKLIFKSIEKQQYIKIRSFLSDYAEYVRDNPNTFLLRIYGLYKLKNKENNRQIYFIVVRNFFDTELRIEQRYDIKGSTHNRQSKRKGPNTALKDLDLINNKERVFNINPTQKNRIYDQIVQDSEFLSSYNLTDYSLLVGISKQAEMDSRTGFKSTGPVQQTYFFGIINILTDYSAKKVLQNHFLHIFISDISCLAPDDYMNRFQEFIGNRIFDC